MADSERDPYEPVVVKGWHIKRCDHGDETPWMLETEGVTLSGEGFTARKHYDDLEDLFEFIRQAAM